MKDDRRNSPSAGDERFTEDEYGGVSEDDAVSAGRREAVAKLVYASPVVAGLLFSKRSAANTPPPPPPPPPPR